MGIRIGIAGFGNHAKNRLLPAVMATDNVELVAVWARNDRHFEVLQGVEHYTDYAEFLAQEMDVVILASPTGMHFNDGMKVLQSGHSLWCEKPIATEPSQVEQMLSLAEQNNLMVQEAFMFLYHNQAQAIRRVVADDLGAIRSVIMKFCFPHLDESNFRYDPNLGGGAFLDHACYLIRGLYEYFGDQWSVLGGQIHQPSDRMVDSAGSIMLAGQDGASASLIWGFGSCYTNEIEVIGEKSKVLIQIPFTKPGGRSADLILTDGFGQQETIPVATEDPYTAMVRAFADQFEDNGSWQRIRDEIATSSHRFFSIREQVQP